MKSSAPLTQEQQVLVEENLELVRRTIRCGFDVNEGICGMGYDDLYQEGCIALCHAAAAYDGSAGARFSTYAERVIRNHLLDYCRMLLAKRRNAPTVALDDYGEAIPGCDETAGISKLQVESLLEHGKRAYKGTARLGIEAMELKVRGFSGTDIARIYGVKPNLVGAWISRAAGKLREDMRRAS